MHATPCTTPSLAGISSARKRMILPSREIMKMSSPCASHCADAHQPVGFHGLLAPGARRFVLAEARHQADGAPPIIADQEDAARFPYPGNAHNGIVGVAADAQAAAHRHLDFGEADTVSVGRGDEQVAVAGGPARCRGSAAFADVDEQGARRQAAPEDVVTPAPHLAAPRYQREIARAHDPAPTAPPVRRPSGAAICAASRPGRAPVTQRAGLPPPGRLVPGW